jgi:hypothetical protein
MTAVIAIAAAMAVRNPFWPIGYEGTREVISAEPKVELGGQSASSDDDTATAEMAARSSTATLPRHWTEARNSLSIGGTVIATEKDGTSRQCVMINGLAYDNGDLISANHNGRRFTWRVEGITKGATIKLKRIRARPLTADELPKEARK